MNYKAVIFDLFGTLVDNFTVSEYQKILADMAAVLNAPVHGFSKLWRDSFYMRTNGTHRTHEESIRYICKELGVAVTDEQVQRSSDLRLDYTIKTLVPRPDTIATIEELKRRGYGVGLVSDCSPETPAAWPKTPFNGLFHVTIFSCEAGVKKPDPRIYRMATDALGVQPQDCLYVGDGSSHELTGATVVGMTALLIRDPGETVDTHFVDREENWQGPTISHLKEVLDLVD